LQRVSDFQELEIFSPASEGASTMTDQDYQEEPMTDQEVANVATPENFEILGQIWDLLIKEDKAPRWAELDYGAQLCWVATFLFNFAPDIMKVAHHVIVQHIAPGRN
jgi:hypothetical protein